MESFLAGILNCKFEKFVDVLKTHQTFKISRLPSRDDPQPFSIHFDHHMTQMRLASDIIEDLTRTSLKRSHNLIKHRSQTKLRVHLLFVP